MRDDLSPRLAEAFRAAPRRRFLPREQRRYADLDLPLRLAHGQTNSQPTTVANMLELLDVRPGQRVLDVGAGSGWTTALLAHLVGPTGRVLAVERVPVLRDGAAKAVAGIGWAEVHLATSGVLGLPGLAPFDRILVSAAPDHLPGGLVAQLDVGAVMVIPVAGELLRVTRLDPDRAEVTRHGFYNFVPLVLDED
ncbi:protein-L-isoaspartate O-methyltransferase family protein [Propionibacteriaceae bacterium Y1923]